MKITDELVAFGQIASALFVLFGFPALVAGGPGSLSDAQFDALISLAAVAFGAVLAVLTQAIFSFEQRKDQRLGAAYAVFFKVQRFASEVAKISAHVRKDMARVKEGQEAWRELRPLYFCSTEVAAFTSDDLELFARANDQQYADVLGDLASLHNLLLGLVAAYNDRRSAWKELTESSGQTIVDAEYASHPPALEDKHKVRLAELENFARHLEQVTREGMEHCEFVTGSISDKLSAHLEDERFNLRLVARVREVAD